MIYKILTLKNMSTDYLKIYKKKENDKMEEKKKTSSKNSNIKKNSNKKNNNKLDNNKNLKKQNIQTKKTVVKDDNKKKEVKKEKVVLEEVKEEVEVKDEEKDAEKEQQIKEKNQNIKLEKIFCIIVAGIFIILLILCFFMQEFIPATLITLSLELFSIAYFISEKNEKDKRIYIFFVIGMVTLFIGIIYTLLKIM